LIAIDIEVYDPNLDTLGDGSIRKDGSVLCVGLFDGSDYVCCVPDDPRLPGWLASTEEKIFHNSVYDVPWLVCGLGFTVNGTLHDTMTRAAMLDPYEDLDLDSCCKRYGIRGKNAADTIEAWFNGVRARWGLVGSLWDNADVIWMHPEGRKQMIQYNEQDCRATYALFMAQEKRMAMHKEAYQLECDLQPLILEMKRNGIAVDVVARDRFTAQIEQELNIAESRLSTVYGITRSMIASPKQLTKAMNDIGVYSPVLTATGGQSWSAQALDMIDHPSIELIQQVKRHQSLLSKYLYGSLTTAIVNGRIHCTFSPNKRDEGGTITGRFASFKPNLQNIPARQEKHGQEMRSMFVPDIGCMLLAIDYSQIEYLLLAHFAQGPQAEWFREQARAGIDFHNVAMSITGIDNRDMVKRLNYGVIYGMGIHKLFAINRKIYGTIETAREVYNTYHARLPVIRDTMQYIQNTMRNNGYMRSIGGRVHYKPKPMFIDGKWNDMLYKSTNYVIQGSAADILKKSMVDALKAGVFNELHLHLTVHDEIVCSMPYTVAGLEAAQTLQQCMNDAYKERLRVPMKACAELGDTWGYWKDDIWRYLCETRDFAKYAHLVKEA
jgi:DNA polymerase-1